MPSCNAPAPWPVSPSGAMDEDLKRQLQRWQDAEADGRDDEADGLCRTLVSDAAREPLLSREFTASMAVLCAIRKIQLDSRRVGSKADRLRNALTNVSCARSSASAGSPTIRQISRTIGR